MRGFGIKGLERCGYHLLSSKPDPWRYPEWYSRRIRSFTLPVRENCLCHEEVKGRDVLLACVSGAQVLRDRVKEEGLVLGVHETLASRSVNIASGFPVTRAHNNAQELKRV